jgi:protein-tyrosine-phosphatase/predicted ATP-grasp superfamily ATP-dependent carboligase/CelD/BcsL family acetyltransferase involved in cellulose biosynthesis
VAEEFPDTAVQILGETSPKVLVLGDDTRSFLATVRSLGRKGLEVHVVPNDMQSAALRSRYIAQIHSLPPYIGDGGEWVRAVVRLLTQENFALVIPCQDAALLPFHAHRDVLGAYTKLAIPDPEAIKVLFNKETTKSLASSLGVNVARKLNTGGNLLPDDIFQQLGTPVVVKPKNSFLLNDLSQRGVVQIVDSPAQLPQALKQLPPDSYYFEEFFEGRGVGLSLLADSGKILLAFQHHRVHEGARGGAAPYRVSAPISPELLDACTKITAHLRFTGVAMFEFRRNFTTGRWILLEVNARPWGSIPLPLSLGIDFPFWWYQLLVRGQRAPSQDYKTGVYGRNLGLDFQFLLSELSEAKSFGARSRVMASWLSSFSHVFIGRERDDTIVADDPLPGIVELTDIFRSYGRRLATRIPVASELEGILERRRGARAVRHTIEKSGRINLLFVCFGNICRSPFAEAVAAKLTKKYGDRVVVRSAGTYHVSGRESPTDAIAVAQKLDFDLAQHRSRSLDASMVEEATVIFVFDTKNRSAILSRFGALQIPPVLLGHFDRTNKSGEISDPFGHGRVEFDRAYRQIAASIRALEQLIDEAFAKAGGPAAQVFDASQVGRVSDHKPTFSLSPVGDLAETEDIWRDLERRSKASFFITWDWIGCWLKQANSPGFLLSGTLSGRVILLGIISPALYRRHGFISSEALLLNQLGRPELDCITIEYNGFLIDKDAGSSTVLACLEFLKKPEVATIVGRPWDEIHLDGVPDNFETQVKGSGLIVWQKSRKPSWRVDLDSIRSSGGSCLDHLSANTRYQIRRSMRLYEKHGALTAKRARNLDEAMHYYSEMEQLHQRYWQSRGQAGAHAFPFYGKFHRALLASCLSRGTAELVRVAAGEATIGYVYNFVHDGWVYAYQTGLDYGANPKLKPGLVAHYLCIERHLSEGAHCYDFLAGDSRYKRSFGTPGPDMLELVLQRPIAKLRIESALREVKRALTHTSIEG